MTFSLPPAIADKPHRDLTEQVTQNVYAAFGGLADIYKGEWIKPDTRERTIVAIKFLRVVCTEPKEWSTMSTRLNRETWVWDQLTHPNVLPFLGISNDVGGEGRPPALISPFCDEGNVLEYLNRNPNADRLKIAVGVAEGLHYLHSNDIIHGDITGRNVLISDKGEPLLCDFGRSRIIGHKGFTSAVLGTLIYQAPELFDAADEEASMDAGKEISNDRLTTKSDVYAYAMVTLQIFTGNAPYYHICSKYVQLKRIVSGEKLQRARYSSPILTDARWALLEECWVKDPKTRPEVDSILPRLL